MRKIPNLTAQEALYLTLRQCKNGVITIGILQNSETTYRVYGENGLELPPALHTYEIGSLTKTFTAALVCQAVKQGLISLDKSIDAYLQLPERQHYPTIRQLLTHTSGYRNHYFETPMIANFFHGRNDFYGIGDSMTLSRLAKTKINASDHSFVYSNFGYATLGLVLEKVYQTEFTTLMNGYINDTLGLSHTHISDGAGDLGHYWDWIPGDTYMAAGALTSDIEDMLEYAQLQLEGAVCGGACLETLEQIKITQPRMTQLGIIMDEIGYSWIIDSQTGIRWHNGGTGNYNCYLGLDRENQTAVVVLSNLSPSKRIPATVVGVKLLAELRNSVNESNN